MTNSFTDYVHEHAGRVMASSHHVADGQDALLADRELHQFPFWRDPSFNIMSQHAFRNSLHVLLPEAHLDLPKFITTIGFLYLHDLGPIQF